MTCRPLAIGRMALTDQETEMMALIANLDYETSISDSTLQQLS